MTIKEQISQNVNMCSSPADLKITDIRVANINGAPKHCPLIKVYTNQGIVGYGEVRDASSATYALMLKSRLIGENPCNVDKIFRRIKQFGGPSRQGGGVSGLEIAMWDLAGKAWGVPLWQMLGGKFRDKVRVYGDTDVDGKHTGADMGRAIRKRIDMGFTIVKMDLGIELLYDEPGCINAPLGMIDDLVSIYEDIIIDADSVTSISKGNLIIKDLNKYSKLLYDDDIKKILLKHILYYIEYFQSHQDF